MPLLDTLSYKKPPLIEIVINVEQARRQAPGSFKREILFLFVHGLLHAIGYDDRRPKDRALMLKLGEKITNECF